MTTKLPSYPKEYLEIQFLEDQFNENILSEPNINLENLPFASSNIYNSSLKSAAYLTHGSDVKTVISICLDIQDLEIEYEVGDTFGILPENNEDEVNELIDRLNYTFIADKKYVLRIKETEAQGKNKIPPHIPTTYTLRKLLLNCLDIRSVPKKGFLRALSKYTSNEHEINTLNEICSVRYLSFIKEENYALLDLLQQFTSCFPPVTIFLEHLPRLLPRPFSVASSPFTSCPPYSELNIIFSVSYIPNWREGVATGWLYKKAKLFLEDSNKNVENEDNLKVRLYRRKRNHFKLPEQIETNIIMICAGTGIAPFIGFMEHLEIQKENNALPSSVRVWLFYGCRYSDKDFLFKDKLSHFKNVNVLSKLFVSFSRENSDVKYIQDNIKINENDFVDMLDNSVVYVCGGANMSKGVFETITDCFSKVKHITKTEAFDFMKNLKKQNKYIEDIWS